MSRRIDRDNEKAFALLVWVIAVVLALVLLESVRNGTFSTKKDCVAAHGGGAGETDLLPEGGGCE